MVFETPQKTVDAEEGILLDALGVAELSSLDLFQEVEESIKVLLVQRIVDAHKEVEHCREDAEDDFREALEARVHRVSEQQLDQTLDLGLQVAVVT